MAPRRALRTRLSLVRGVASAAVAGALGASCGGPGAPLAGQVSSWALSTGFSAGIAQIRGDLEHSAQLASDTGAALRTVCDVLVTDTLNANQQLPTPDATLTRLLSQAYGEAGTAGHACYAGASGDTAQLARAAQERTAALRSLVQAQARYDSLTSSLPASP
ncbi:MAG: hypothetical protein ACYDD4_12875 [Acidimicrobiales bacterium]